VPLGRHGFAPLGLAQVEHPARAAAQGLELALDPRRQLPVDVDHRVEQRHRQPELAGEGEEPVGVLRQAAAGERGATADAVAGVQRPFGAP